MSAADYDTIIVGGGFAGLTAARELAHHDQRVLVLEARDRLGGRTWYHDDVLDGRPFELGGTWVHWTQPHVFAEITRYGLELAESIGAAEPKRVFYVTGGERKDISFEDAWPLLEDAIDRFCHDAHDLLERPYDPLYKEHEGLADVDRLSVQDRIDELGLDPDQRDMLNAIWALCCSAKCGEGGAISMMRWYALVGWDTGMVFDAATRYKFKTGTRSLIDAIAADSGAEIRLAAPVTSVEQDEEGVTVTTPAGVVRGRHAIVTVPLNTLRDLTFTPELSEPKRAAAGEGQASHGSKLWVRVRGDLPEPLFALAPDDRLLNYLQTEVLLEDGQILVGFGYDAASLDVTDIDAVTGPVRDLLGDVEVVATAGHDWLADEYSRGTWPVLRPTQTVRLLRELQQPEGRIHFAGSETADGWNGFIDGAIESGLRAARAVARDASRPEPAQIAVPVHS
jgi:pseudooxynicotine dehydrogenase